MRALLSSSSTTRESKTFLVSIWVLGFIAALQFVALVWKVLPNAIIRPKTEIQSDPAVSHQSNSTITDHPNVVRQTASEFPYEQLSPNLNQTSNEKDLVNSKTKGFFEGASSPSSLQMQLAMARVNEAESASRVGDWQTVLRAISEAEAILGEEPRLMLQKAFALERIGREMDAADLLVKILSRSDLDSQTRQEALRLQDWVSQTIENMERSGISPLPPTQTQYLQEVSQNQPSMPILEEIGLQPGATLGIVDIRQNNGENNTKNFRIAVKARPGVNVRASDTNVLVRFFEKTATGEILQSKSQASSEWISPPVDWAEKEPEILEVRYSLNPKSKNTFYGYTVALYYKDELQDTRADPGHLENDFPAELFLQNSITTPP
ncbi:MAG: hypothetical protein N2035_05190 [Chthoniobacterales bacterium]|nr:hypothetical protein [Chthoniobacterales bacterium]